MMIMQHVIIYLAPTPVTVRLDTVEMDGTVQVCAREKTTFNIMDDTFFSTDINECEVPGGVVLCDENADCDDTDGSYVCLCRTGYSGSGLNCSGLCETNERNR